MSAAETAQRLFRDWEKADVMAADEVFTTGNYGKVLPITRVEDRAFAPGPVYRRARDLYWDFAASS